MPANARYYPEWTINNPIFLAESLLFWARLARIVPFPHFHGLPQHEDEEMRQVMADVHERFVSPFLPTADQKHLAHHRIVEFAKHDPPGWYRPENLASHDLRSCSRFKLARQTVDLLVEKGWAWPLPRSNSYDLHASSAAAADVVIGAILDACSSSSLPPITSEPDTFAANSNLLVSELVGRLPRVVPFLTLVGCKRSCQPTH